MTNYSLTPWKYACLALCAILCLHHGTLQAQCANNLFVRTYDTVISGPGYGTYQLSFPKWRLDSPMLVSVKVSAVVNVKYGYTLKNVDAMSGNYGLWVGREDMISSSALPAAYDKINEAKLGAYTLSPGDQVVVAPFPWLTNYVNVDSFSNGIYNFLGTGKVSFTYSPITYTNIHTSNNASYSYKATATETTRFSVTYVYCKDAGIILARNLTSFSAMPKDAATVRLDWTIGKEAEGRSYEVQRSTDGENFVAAGTQASVLGSNSYMQEDQPGKPGKWYYRLKITAPGAGAEAYSAVKEVILGQQQGAKLTLYPNPAVDHINLVMPGDAAQPGSWRVAIRAADGRLIQQAVFYHSNSFFINFRQQLSPGVYFIRISDMTGAKDQVAAFRVDR